MGGGGINLRDVKISSYYKNHEKFYLMNNKDKFTRNNKTREHSLKWACEMLRSIPAARELVNMYRRANRRDSLTREECCRCLRAMAEKYIPMAEESYQNLMRPSISRADSGPSTPAACGDAPIAAVIAYKTLAAIIANCDLKYSEFCWYLPEAVLASVLAAIQSPYSPVKDAVFEIFECFYRKFSHVVLVNRGDWEGNRECLTPVLETYPTGFMDWLNILLDYGGFESNVLDDFPYEYYEEFIVPTLLRSDYCGRMGLLHSFCLSSFDFLMKTLGVFSKTVDIHESKTQACIIRFIVEIVDVCDSRRWPFKREFDEMVSSLLLYGLSSRLSRTLAAIGDLFSDARFIKYLAYRSRLLNPMLFPVVVDYFSQKSIRPSDSLAYGRMLGDLLIIDRRSCEEGLTRYNKAGGKVGGMRAGEEALGRRTLRKKYDSK